MSKTNHQRGFTLLEILISMTIIGGMGILIAQVFFSTTRVNTKTELLKDVKQNGQFAIDTMTRMLRNSSSVESTCSTAGTTAKSLTIANVNGDNTTLGCALTNGVTRIASTSASVSASEYLTSQNLTLGGTTCADNAMSLSFVCTSYADLPSKVTISFRLYQKGSPADQFEKASQLFQTTINLRN